jgi:CRISPR-associated protein Cas2
MTVLVANDVPPAIRGHLKRWFVEPRPNVFVGTLNPRTYRKVIDFIIRNAPQEFGMLCLSSQPNCQGYIIERMGPEGKTGRRDLDMSGLHLIAEEWIAPENKPF